MVNIEHLEWLSKLPRKELYELLERVLVELQPIESLQKQTEECKQKARELRHAIKGTDMNTILGASPKEWIIFFLCTLTIVLMPFAFVRLNKKVKKLKENLNRQIDDVLSLSERSENSAQEKRKKAEYMPLLPKGYCYSLAVKTMIEFIENDGVDSWKELAREYKEQCHRWEMQADSKQRLELQIQQAQATEEILEQQRKTKNWAAIAAIGSVVTAAGVWSRR